MKTKCVSQSAFFNPRALLRGIGLALAMFAFLAFPNSALASPCSDVEFNENWTGYQQVKIQMSSDPGCTIYYTVMAWQPPYSNPTHSSAIFNPQGNPNYQGLGIPAGYVYCYKALAYNPNATPVDSAITSYCVDNTGN